MLDKVYMSEKWLKAESWSMCINQSVVVDYDN